MHLSESDGQQQHLRSRVAQLENSVAGLETQLESARLVEAELQLQLEGERSEASAQLQIHQTTSATRAVTDGAASEAPETVVRLNRYLPIGVSSSDRLTRDQMLLLWLLLM